MHHATWNLPGRLLAVLLAASGGACGNTSSSRDAGAGAASEVCALVTMLGRDDHAGATVQLGGAALSATTDRDGRFCFDGAIDFTGEAVVTFGAVRQVLPKVKVDATGIASWDDERATPWQELELSPLPRVVAGWVDRVFAAESGDAFVYTIVRLVTWEPGVQLPTDGELTRGYFDGRPPTALGTFRIASASNELALFRAETALGTRLFVRTATGQSQLLDLEQGGPIDVRHGEWLSVAPSGRFALLADDALYAVELSAAAPPTPRAVAESFSAATALSFSSETAGPSNEDDYVYFSDERTTTDYELHPSAPLRRRKLPDGASELVADNAILGSVGGSSDGWIWWAELEQSRTKLRYVNARADGSAAYEPGRRMQAAGGGYVEESLADPKTVTYVSKDRSERRELGRGGLVFSESGLVGIASSEDRTRTLRIVHEDGSGLFFTTELAQDETWSSFTLSKDRKAFSYVTERGEYFFTFHLRLVDGSLHVELPEASWSAWHDGEYVLVSGKRADEEVLHVLATDGTSHFQADRLDSTAARVTSDGRLLYATVDADGEATLHVATMQGESLLTIPGASDPQLSPQGTRWLFQKKHRGSNVLASLDADGNVRLHARGTVKSWLSETRVLVTHQNTVPAQRGLYALDLAQ